MPSPTGQTGTAIYTNQLVIMLTEQVAEIIAQEAAEKRLSKSEVARNYIQAGLNAQISDPNLPSSESI